MRARCRYSATDATATTPATIHCTRVRRAAGTARTRVSTAVAAPTTTASTSTVGDADKTPSAAPSDSENTATPGRTEWVRISTAKVMSATTAKNPSMLRVPKMPWIGPNEAMLPWMPRKRSGVSKMIPLSTSSTSETDSAARSTSPSARTVCSVSRTCPIVTARRATAAIAVHRQKLEKASLLQNTLANAQVVNIRSVVGTSRRNEISSRRATRMPMATTHRPAMIVRRVTIPATATIRCVPTSVANTVSVNARAKSAEAARRSSAPATPCAPERPGAPASDVIAEPAPTRPVPRRAAAPTRRGRRAAPA